MNKIFLSVVSLIVALCCVIDPVEIHAQFNTNKPGLRSVTGHNTPIVDVAIISVGEYDADNKTALVKLSTRHRLGEPTEDPLCNSFRILSPGGGQYIEIIIGDENAITATRITTTDNVRVPVKAGLNYIRAYLCYDDGECVKHNDAIAAVKFDTRMSTMTPLKDDTMLIFNLPRRSDRFGKTVLDFAVRNVDFSKQYISVIVDGEEIDKLREWQLYDLDLVERSRLYEIELKLMNNNFTQVSSPLTTAKRQICVAR